MKPLSLPVTAAATPALSINNVSITEGNASTVRVNFTVTMSTTSSRTITVHYASVSNTAKSPGDFTAVSGTLTFGPGRRTVTVGVNVVGETVRESDESFYVDLSSAANATIARRRGTATVRNDDATPSLSIGNVSVVEGAFGTTNAVFRVTLSNPSASTVTVDYATQDDSASAPSDYTSSSGTLTFAPLSTLRTLTVPVNGNGAVEDDEIFDVDIFNAVHATLADDTGEGTILNDDSPTISVGDVTLAEGDSGTTDAVFTVTLSAPTPSTVTVDFQTLDGSADAPTDYQPHMDTVTFAPGVTSQPVTIEVNGDTLSEPDETVFVHLTNAVQATILDGFGVGHILNDDVVVPTLAIASPGAQNEGSSGTTSAVFTVTLSAAAAAASAVTVDYTTADGSATVADGDYVADSGTLTFTPGQTNKQITVLINGDSAVEANESFTVVLSGATNATISGSGVGTETITNDDTLPTLTVASPAPQNEGNSGTTNSVFIATMSSASASTVTVDYATVDGSATSASGDYVAQSGTLTFTAGQTVLPITVLINGDTTVEPNESLTLALSNATNATIAGAGTGTQTITNDDALPTVTITSPAAQNEGNSGTTNSVFTVTLSAPSAGTVTVDYATADGSATSPADYVAQSGTLTFAAGQTNKQIVLLVNGDTTIETNESFTVNVSNPTNSTIAGAGTGTATITNDDALPTVSIASPAAQNEGNSGTANSVFIVTLSSVSSSTVTVDFATADGSATAPADYVAQSGTLTFTPGLTILPITVLINGDTTVEPNEAFSLLLANPTNSTLAGAGTGTATITNDDTLPTVSLAAPAAQNEGNSGTTNSVFIVTLSAASASTVTVDYATVDGSAAAPSDYTALSGTLTFTAGQTILPITVLVNGDSTVEPNESFTLALSNPTNSTIAGSAIGTGTITNDDTPPTVTLAAPAATNEGNSGTTNFVFTVTLSAPSASTVTVDYATADGSATAASGDYTALGGTLTFVAGQTSKQLTVLVNGDTTVETNETFTMNLSNPSNATIATASAATTITNDDTLPTVTIASPAAVNEGNSGTTNSVFTVTLSAPAAGTVTVDYVTADGSATAPSDYVAQSGTLTFAAGQTNKQITVLINGDTTVEINETFTMNLSNPTNATVTGTGIGTQTITNDDTLPTLAVAAPAATNEGNSGTTNFVFTVTLSALSASTVTVDYATADGSATSASNDYTALSGTMTFTAGQTSKQLTVLVNGDATVETNETFTVNLSNPTNATIATASAAATITNDDTLPTLTMTSPGAQSEGNVGTTNSVFIVTLSAVSASTVTVDYTTVDGSATSASGDYTAQSGTLTFTAGQTSRQITVLINGDTTVETNETFTVNLSNPINSTIAGTGIGTQTINNDDTVPTLAVAAPAATNEGNSGTTNFVFTVTLSAPSSSTVTVDYTTVDGSATSASSDYTAQSATLTYSAGQTSKQVTVLVNGDTTIETNETFTVNLSNPSNATVATASAAATITNDDTLPTLTMTSPAAVTEGNAGTTINGVFTVTLSAPSVNAVTVDYATADGSATAASGDYTAQGGTLTFAAGQTSQQIAVVIKGDTLNEINETLTVNLSNPTNATIAGTGIGTETITNDDAVPTLAINNVSQLEGTGGTTNWVFTVTLSTASGLSVTVDFATANGTASSASDYTAQTGTLTFTPGQTTKTVTVVVTADAVNEANETFTVVLSNPSNATITTATGTGTIQNDD